MRIKVTQDDIDAGKKGNCLLCPIAVAIRRHLVSGAFVTVATGFVVVICGDIVRKIDLPQTASECVRMVDKGESAIPFEFELDIPKEAIR